MLGVFIDGACMEDSCLAFFVRNWVARLAFKRPVKHGL